MRAAAETEFRPEIAGLRAVAVLPIVLFHAGFDTLAGGFVGVDIFFVISGFVITQSIMHGLHSGQFSMVEFYRRRVARIVPALVLVILATLAAGLALLLPIELADLGRSAGAAAAFCANFYFAFTTDYFGGAAESKPLLHLWSLGVEEQFYIFFPLLVLWLWRWNKSWILPIIAALSVASFALALGVGQWRSELSFYLLPTRAWELGMGALVALGAHPTVASAGRRQLPSAGGALLILTSIFFIRPGEFFPAPAALLPTLGTALIIAYGKGTWSATALSTRPLVAIGAISYSLYLWHWPVITFWRLQTGNALDMTESVILVGASVALATLTYVTLERPSKRLLNGVRRRGRVVVAGGLLLAILSLGAFGLAARPEAWRDYPSDVNKLASVAAYRATADYAAQYPRKGCFVDDGQAFDKRCVTPSENKPDLIVFGDSHAAQYWKAFAEQRPAWAVHMATGSGCRPVVNGKGTDDCKSMVRYILDDAAVPGRVDEVLFAGRWRRTELPKLYDAIERVRTRGLPVTVIGPTVEYDGDLPIILARSRLSDAEQRVSLWRKADRRKLDLEMAPRVRALGARYISPYELECPKDQCRLVDGDGDPIHFDYGHTTLAGARIIVAQMEQVLAGPAELR